MSIIKLMGKSGEEAEVSVGASWPTVTVADISKPSIGLKYLQSLGFFGAVIAVFFFLHFIAPVKSFPLRAQSMHRMLFILLTLVKFNIAINVYLSSKEW